MKPLKEAKIVLNQINNIIAEIEDLCKRYEHYLDWKPHWADDVASEIYDLECELDTLKEKWYDIIPDQELEDHPIWDNDPFLEYRRFDSIY